MIYKKIELIKDENIFDGVNISHLAKAMGVDRSYLSQVKNERIVCNEKFRNAVLTAKKTL